ncbi:hypothetical protein HETIRDRAFT_66253 [Heterobasidion irregulare TC 32-1]|uniref:Uncharacterized protein n=1 Tax=Heterobasidion irregulare (strain TC 32-1) TaxID=747525 RepID=W4JSG1_HETIT|nr:uncharacterized protein HETIRDRAFT_66253 [Heterobasidion irregulare TC 32-1]ETW75791.1 hypothetical protein HETIRDRAFT_66253 [Heterobasidion irregulare TC 32-1]
MQTGLIQNAHNDLVTDAAYDFYGLRLATCSVDQRIKIWQLDEQNGIWNVTSDWKAHDAAVSRVSWAHPEFGSVIASGSFDRSVKVWEETTPDIDQPQLNGNAPSSASDSRWVERAVNTDAKGSVRGVEFAPHHFGLKLSTISSDNHIRVYECLEAPSLTNWQLIEEVDVLSIPSIEADGGWSISWCKERYWGEIIATSCGTNGIVKVLFPATFSTFPLSSSPSAITSVAWAPCCGRSYHLVATGGRDGHVRIWRLKPPASNDERAEADETRWTCSIVADFDHHKSTVGRVEWNITGTILSSAGNDGRIRLWKATTGNVWRPAGNITVEQAEEQPGGDVEMDDNGLID